MNTLSFGMSSFHDLTTLSLTGNLYFDSSSWIDFTSLTTIELKSHSFASLKQFTMKNLPKVQTILAEDYTCYHVEEFEIACKKSHFKFITRYAYLPRYCYW